jgi:hypothetical protein
MPRQSPQIRFRSLESLEGRLLFAGLAAGGASPEHTDVAPGGIAGVSLIPKIAHVWQNPVNHLKVTGAAGQAVPLDALIVVNELNNRLISDPAKGRLPEPFGPAGPPPYYDVSGDGFVTSIDALLIFNDLNNRARRLAEGEGEPPALSAAIDDAIFGNARHSAEPWAVPAATSSRLGDAQRPEQTSAAPAVSRNQSPHYVSSFPHPDRQSGLSEDLLELLATDCVMPPFSSLRCEHRNR